MPVNIKNQPVQWNLPALGRLDEQYYQLLSEDDLINFQMLADLGENIYLVENMELPTTEPTYVTLVDGYFVWNAPGTIQDSDLFEMNTNYKVSFRVVSGFFGIDIGTDTFQIGGEGYYELYGNTGASTLFRVGIGAGDAVLDADMTIQEIEDPPVVAAIDMSGTVTEILWNHTSIINENVLWEDRPLPTTIDCFRLTFLLDDGNILPAISADGEWPITGPGVKTAEGFTGTNIGGPTSISRTFNTGTYTTFLPSVTATQTNIDFTLEITNALGDVVYSEGFTSGSHIFPYAFLEANSNYTITITATPTDPSNEFVISSVLLNHFVSNGQTSNPFQKITSVEGTRIFTANDDDDVYMFKFNGAFKFNLRTLASVFFSQDQTEAETVKYSTGVRQLRYSDSEEVFTVSTDHLPLYLHQALRKMRLMNTFEIDGFRFVVNDEGYSTDWNKDYNLAPGEFDITYYHQNYRNVNGDFEAADFLYEDFFVNTQ